MNTGTRITAKQGLSFRIAVNVGSLREMSDKKKDDDEEFKKSIKSKLPKNMK